MLKTSLLDYHVAEVADAISWAWFHRQPRVHAKPTAKSAWLTAVPSDRALVELLSRERPTDIVFSEKSGTTTTAKPTDQGPVRRWLVDPIAGTDPRLAGDRAWGTHIALEVDGGLELAVLTRHTEPLMPPAVTSAG